MFWILLNKTALRLRKAQSIAEYSIIAAAIILGLVVMGTYIKRGLSGRYAEVVNATVKSANTTQYEPYYQDNKNIIQTEIKEKQDIKLKGALTRDISQEYNYTIRSYGVVPDSGGGGQSGGTTGSSVNSLFPSGQTWAEGRDPAQAANILSSYSFEVAGGYTLAEVQSKFAELYNSDLGSRYANVDNAVYACLEELAEHNYITLYDNRS
jgi:hypothetical protein